jgi:hypothetical protein
MSRQNKVNPDHYKLAGRLSPDDLARERQRHVGSQPGPLRGRNRKPIPPWATGTRTETGGAADVADAASAGTTTPRGADSNVTSRRASNEEAAQQPQPKPGRRAVKPMSGRRPQKKTARRKMAAGKQRTARLQAASRMRRSAPKAGGAKATPRTRKKR